MQLQYETDHSDPLYTNNLHLIYVHHVWRFLFRNLTYIIVTYFVSTDLLRRLRNPLFLLYSFVPSSARKMQSRRITDTEDCGSGSRKR